MYSYRVYPIPGIEDRMAIILSLMPKDGTRLEMRKLGWEFQQLCHDNTTYITYPMKKLINEGLVKVVARGKDGRALAYARTRTY